MPKRSQPPMDSVGAGAPRLQPAEVRHLLEAARQQAARAVSDEFTQPYRRIRRRINAELLQRQGADMAGLTAEFGTE